MAKLTTETFKCHKSKRSYKQHTLNTNKIAIDVGEVVSACKWLNLIKDINDLLIS